MAFVSFCHPKNRWRRNFAFRNFYPFLRMSLDGKCSLPMEVPVVVPSFFDPYSLLLNQGKMTTHRRTNSGPSVSSTSMMLLRLTPILPPAFYMLS
jgi:hypothetical protein